jgi:large subunit ribosomal protein L5
MAPRLKEKYSKEIMPELLKQFGYKSSMQIPKLEKIVINIGVGEAIQDIKNLDAAVNDLTLISGQKPIIRRAKKSISNFKLRANVPIGCKVTLRRERMYEFLDRLLTFAVPKIRDFRGLPGKSFDGRGSYSMGLKEQIIFPEIDIDKIDKTRGMNITFVTNAKRDEEAKALMKAFGMPFRD